MAVCLGTCQEMVLVNTETRNVTGNEHIFHVHEIIAYNARPSDQQTL